MEPVELIVAPEHRKFLMRGGYYAEERKFGRIPSKNKTNKPGANRRSLKGDQPIISNRWMRGADVDGRVWLDQGNEPACVGFTWSLDMASRPVAIPGITNETAQALYELAKTLDEYPGVNYDGTSTEGGAKASVAQGKIGLWVWAETIQEIKLTIGYDGPVPFGTNWYSNMDTPDPVTGIVNIGGYLRGGHEILINGYDADGALFGLGPDIFRVANSWGKGWGRTGNFFITATDLDTLIFKREGDAIIILERFAVAA